MPILPTLDTLLTGLGDALTPLQNLTSLNQPQDFSLPGQTWKLPINVPGGPAGNFTVGLRAKATLQVFNSAASLKNSGDPTGASADDDGVLGLPPAPAPNPASTDPFTPAPWTPLVEYNPNSNPPDAWIKLRLEADADAALAASFMGITGDFSANASAVAALYLRANGNQTFTDIALDAAAKLLTPAVLVNPLNIIAQKGTAAFSNPDTVFAMCIGKGVDVDLKVDIIKLIAALLGDAGALISSIKLGSAQAPLQVGPTVTVSGSLQTSDSIVLAVRPLASGNLQLGLRRAQNEKSTAGVDAGVNFSLDAKSLIPALNHLTLNDAILQQILSTIGNNPTLSGAILAGLKDASTPLGPALAKLPVADQTTLNTWLQSLLSLPNQEFGVDLNSVYAGVQKYVADLQKFLDHQLPLTLSLLFTAQYSFSKSDGTLLMAEITPANFWPLLPSLLAGNLTSSGNALNPANYVKASFLGQEITSVEWSSGFSLSLFGLKLGASQDTKDDQACLTRITVASGQNATINLLGRRRTWTYEDDALFYTFSSRVQFVAQQPHYDSTNFLATFKFALDFEWQDHATAAYDVNKFIDLANLAAILGHYTFDEIPDRGKDFYLVGRGVSNPGVQANFTFPLASLDPLIVPLSRLTLAHDAPAAFAAAMPWDPNHPEYKTDPDCRLAWIGVWTYLLQQAAAGRPLSGINAGTYLQEIIVGNLVAANLIPKIQNFLDALPPAATGGLHPPQGGYFTDRNFRAVLTNLGTGTTNPAWSFSQWTSAWAALQAAKDAGTVSWDRLSSGVSPTIIQGLSLLAANPYLILVQAGLVRQALAQLGSSAPTWSSAVRVDLSAKNLLVSQNNPITPLS